MTTLIAGASGATGRLLVEELLKKGQKVKVIVRPSSKINSKWSSNENVTIVKVEISEIGVDEMAGYVADCDSIAVCLGHNMSLKGIYGHPRKLVTDSVKLLCDAVVKNKSSKPVKLVLMNTAGNSNRNLEEPTTTKENIAKAFIRKLLPPHVDNEKASDYLRLSVKQNNEFIEWVVVRPDTLLDQDQVSKYEVHPSPIRSAIFNPGKTSRINVANFMASLVVDEKLWEKWKGQMPVVYSA